MKWTRQLLATVAAVTMAGASSSAIARDVPSWVDRLAAKAAWAEALKRDTLEGYAEFAMNYPDSVYARAAYGRLREADPSGGDGRPQSAAAPAEAKLDDEDGFADPSRYHNQGQLMATSGA